MNTLQLQDNEQLDTIVQSAPIGICILDAATFKAELLNDKFLEIAGKPKEAIVGKWYWEPFAEARSFYEAAMSEVVRTGVAYFADEAALTLIRHGREELIYVTFVYAPVVNTSGEINKLAVWVIENTRQVRERRTVSDSEKRLRALVTATSDVIYSLSADWEVMQELDGRGFLIDTNEPVVGWREQYIFQEDLEMVNAAVNEAIRGKKIFQLEHRVLRTDGSAGWTLSRAVPILDDLGNIVEWFGTASDVTERKQTEYALSQSSAELQAINEEMAATNEKQAASNEELIVTNNELFLVNKELQEARLKIEEGETALRLALEAANFGTWFINSQTREFITDTRLKELFGYYPYETLSVEQCLAQITDEHREFVATKFENAIYNNGDYDLTYPVIGFHDEELRWLRAIGNLKADPSGAFSAFTGVVMDITAQHLAAQKIEDSEKHFRYLADLVPAKISNALPSGEVTFFNKQWLDYSGMSFEDMRDFGYHAMMHPEEIPDFVEKLGEAAAKGMALESEMRFKDVNGKYRWHLNIASPIINEKGEVTMWVGSTTDIQRIKEEEQRKSDFIGMVSHELKTPLTSLNAYLQVLQARFGKTDDHFTQRSLDQSVKQVKKMTSMINGFLNVARLESSQIAINKSLFDIQELFAEAQEEINPMHTAHSITFACKDAMWVFADREKIGQVLNNLISNAVKYSKPGTDIVINCNHEPKQVVISVRDSGIGIRPDDLKHVFERYYRAGSQGHISGFGIGLYLCAEIIRRHDGKIWAESEINNGSIFYFSLSLNL